MKATLSRLLSRKPIFRPGPAPTPRLVLTEGCVTGLRGCLAPETRKGHEGIAYLAGRTDGAVTLAIASMRPVAETTRGSFNVGAAAMGRIVRAATDRGLQVIGQVHTHPGRAYHSDGDEDGARIAYTGYVSIVLPEYGRRLPGFDDAAVFMFHAGKGFVAVDPAHFGIVPERLA